MIGGQLWIWKEPVNGHKYVMGIDVSRGDSEDFSCFVIIDFDKKEQVLEFVGKLWYFSFNYFCFGSGLFICKGVCLYVCVCV